MSSTKPLTGMKQAGLGIRFYQAIETTLARIAQHPNSFPTVKGGARRVLVEKFPYSIIYRVKAEVVVVVAVIHHRRNPIVWERRR